MSDPAKRRLFDSVDPEFDDTIPGKDATTTGTTFFQLYSPVFQRNAHFSVRRSVPELGDEGTGRATVERFYEFWLRFESWRTFDLRLDLPDGESVENREERRYLERQVRAEGAKQKEEEAARLHQLVEQALKADPRLQRWKDEDRRDKEAKKLAKELAQKLHEQELARIAQVERERRDRDEQEQREKAAALKLLREARKKELKQARKALRGCVESRIQEGPRRARLLVDLETLFQRGSGGGSSSTSGGGGTTTSIRTDSDDVDSLRELLAAMESCTLEEDVVALVAARMSSLAAAAADTTTTSSTTTASTTGTSAASCAIGASADRPWSEEERKLLVKAVNMFPGGIKDRWNTIAEYIATHSGHAQRKAGDIIAKSREGRRGGSIRGWPAVPSSSSFPTRFVP